MVRYAKMLGNYFRAQASTRPAIETSGVSRAGSLKGFGLVSPFRIAAMLQSSPQLRAWVAMAFPA